MGKSGWRLMKFLPVAFLILPACEGSILNPDLSEAQRDAVENIAERVAVDQVRDAQRFRDLEARNAALEADIDELEQRVRELEYERLLR